MSISAEEKNRYLREAAIVLAREGFQTDRPHTGGLHVLLDGSPLCEVTESGGVTYRNEDTVSVTVIPPRHQSQTLQRRGCRQALAAAGSVFSPERWAALPAGLRIAPRRSCHDDSM